MNKVKRYSNRRRVVYVYRASPRLGNTMAEHELESVAAIFVELGYAFSLENGSIALRDIDRPRPIES